jgi:excisionase family DNA binding protein
MNIKKIACRYSQAAAVLGVSTRTIRRWVHLGLLPVIRVTQRTVLIGREIVESLRRPPLPSARSRRNIRSAITRS